MNTPEIEILGVYRLRTTEKLVREQAENLYRNPDTEAVKKIRELLRTTVLIEVMVRYADARFEILDFTQPRNEIPDEYWPVPWAEAYLSPDGESLVVDRWSPMPSKNNLRVAFFMPYWDLHTLLRTSYGDLKCPEAQEMPERLLRLVPYELLD